MYRQSWKPTLNDILIIVDALAGESCTDSHGSPLSPDILIICGALAGDCCTGSHGSPLSPDILIVGGAIARDILYRQSWKLTPTVATR